MTNLADKDTHSQCPHDNGKRHQRLEAVLIGVVDASEIANSAEKGPEGTDGSGEEYDGAKVATGGKCVCRRCA